MTKTNRDESLRALLRLLIDEIVEDLSRSSSGCESRSVQKPSLSMDVIGPAPRSRRRPYRQFSGLNNDFKKCRVFVLPPGISSFR
jgi:hypothetical protein